MTQNVLDLWLFSPDIIMALLIVNSLISNMQFSDLLISNFFLITSRPIRRSYKFLNWNSSVWDPWINMSCIFFLVCWSARLKIHCSRAWVSETIVGSYGIRIVNGSVIFGQQNLTCRSGHLSIGFSAFRQRIPNSGVVWTLRFRCIGWLSIVFAPIA